MKPAAGFSLIELAIVLVILTLLIGGLAVPLAAQIEARRASETQRTLDQALEALQGYALSHPVTPSATCSCLYDGGILDPASTCPAPRCPATWTEASLLLPAPRFHLPCPDVTSDPEPGIDQDGDGTPNDANNGLEDRRADGSCVAERGNLPWATLGVADQDAWGRRLRYHVTPDMAHRAIGIAAQADGVLQVCATSVNAGENDCPIGTVARDVAAVVLSHGANGLGALSVAGIAQAAPQSPHERENANTDHDDREYVSRSPSLAGSSAGEFDDLVRWLSASQLRARLCPSGGCP